MPAGWDNTCEEEFIDEYDEKFIRTTKTKPEVIHAEANAILKLAKSNDGGDGADLFCTHAPCIDCAKLIYGAGIKNVFYRNTYRNDDGLKFLEKCGIKILHQWWY